MKSILVAGMAVFMVLSAAAPALANNSQKTCTTNAIGVTKCR